MKESLELMKIVPALPDMAANIFGSYPERVVGEERINLRQYWRVMRKHLWLIGGISLLATVLASVYLARMPDLYEAQARVQVNLENANSGFGPSKNSSVIFNNPVNDPAYFNTQLQVLTDPSLLTRVVKSLDVEHNPNIFTLENKYSRWQRIQSLAGRGQNSPAQPVPIVATISGERDTVAEATIYAPYVERLLKDLTVEPVVEKRTGGSKDTRLIDIRFSHPQPAVAARVVNAIANAFALSNLEEKTSTNAAAGDFLQKRIAELQGQIRSSEERLIVYAKSNQILSLDASQNTVVDRLTGLNKQLLEAENDRKLAEAAFNASQAPGAALALAENDTKQIPDIENRLGELKQKRADLLVETTEKWPEVKAIDQQILALQKHVEETRNRSAGVLTTNLATRYRQALTRERSLRDAFEQQKGETLTQNEAAVNYRIIQQEIDTNKNLLDGLLQRSKENDVVLAGMPNNISVRHYAISPQLPVGPKRWQLSALILVLSLIVGIALAFFLDYLDDTVRSVADVEKDLRLPALAIIPAIGGAARRRLLSARKQRNESYLPNAELLVNVGAYSSLAEAYRQLRTSVLLSTAGRPPKTLLVTSSMPSEGKTTTAINTAISLAQTGARVLLIEADMRRPRLQAIFGLERHVGLSTILSSEISEADTLAAIQHHESAGIDMLPCGPLPPNPAELLGSEQMRRLLSMLAPAFTHIVIDSPPIASVTDGVLLASMVDGVLLVIHGGSSSRNVVRRSKQLLQDVGARILGVVMNKVAAHTPDYYYYNYHYSKPYEMAGGESTQALPITR
jgi:succinoglycan biosynthesis transport protein ExoP